MQSANRRSGRPPAAKSANTRGRIIGHARRVFFEAATLSAIARRADLTRPAINHYFKSKRELYRAVVETTEASVAVGIQQGRDATTLLGQLLAFFHAVAQVDAEDRSPAAFLVTSVLESRRHPQWSDAPERDMPGNIRAFVLWAVNGAVERGELSPDIEVGLLVDVLSAIVWGMGFYAGFLSSDAELEVITDQFRNMVTGKLWNLER